MAAVVCLVQSNPHKRLRHLYGPRMMAQYKGVPLGELSPHVYAIAEQVLLFAGSLHTLASGKAHKNGCQAWQSALSEWEGLHATGRS